MNARKLLYTLAVALVATAIWTLYSGATAMQAQAQARINAMVAVDHD